MRLSRSLLKVVQESRYWELLGFEIPNHINAVYMRYNSLQLIYEAVLDVVKDYNKILDSLSPEERLFFKPLVVNVEKKINPGLSKLNWGTLMADEYIIECSNAIAEVAR